MITEKIKLLFDDSIEPDEGLVASLEEIGRIPDVQMVVGMVDLHLKRKTENPSSVAIATGERIIPKLTSAAQNCGMSLVNTDLTIGDITDEKLNRFFGRLRTDDDEIMRHPELSIEDMRRAVCLGAPSVLDRYGLPESYLEGMEFGGVIGSSDLLPWRVIDRLVPRRSLERGRYGFGVIPSGNHFLEIQRIDDILDEQECGRWNLRQGGIVLMSHSDGGSVSDDIGNLYGNRTTATGYIKLSYNLRKSALHMRDTRSPGNWGEKKKYYFGKGKYIEIDPESYEGKRYLQANRLSMNAGYASRMTTIGRLRRLMTNAFSNGSPGLRLLCDFSHNSIFRENVEGRSSWIHRHNACRVIPGQLVFLPGYSYTSSYICVGDEGAANTLHTMDHGAGKTIDRLKERGIGRRLDDGRATRRYSNEAAAPELVQHWSDEGIDKVIDLLALNRVVRPIARLTPMAGYRYYWKGRLARLREKLSLR
jgi:RNA-splicing ligase RtcB